MKSSSYCPNQNQILSTLPQPKPQNQSRQSPDRNQKRHQRIPSQPIQLSNSNLKTLSFCLQRSEPSSKPQRQTPKAWSGFYSRPAPVVNKTSHTTKPSKSLTSPDKMPRRAQKSLRRPKKYPPHGPAPAETGWPGTASLFQPNVTQACSPVKFAVFILYIRIRHTHHPLAAS